MVLMNKPLSGISKVFIVVLLILIVIVGAAFFLNTKRGGSISKPTPTPTTESPVWQGLTPGVSSNAEVESVLGSPISKSTSGDKTTEGFSSTSLNYPNEITFDTNGKAVFIRRIVTAKDNFNVKDITDTYGAGSTRLYGPESVNGMDLYVYPTKGVAYLGNPDGNVVLEVWYFVPTTLENFLKTWATSYSVQPTAQPF